ncbi:hypothetical protein D8B26_001786 [Coccidioides posadasii str. Silveira]|uniref:uncharacterized protein n=1 Tax=Coccidioides posadasii (strain RMSCC 757 / Silveira) TaxID=443226 RepID=UPI001BEE197E|nr:hypothetical protein D8B26_001786 [Coccidioides posadasii str. Silveira]
MHLVNSFKESELVEEDQTHQKSVGMNMDRRPIAGHSLIYQFLGLCDFAKSLFDNKIPIEGRRFDSPKVITGSPIRILITRNKHGWLYIGKRIKRSGYHRIKPRGIKRKADNSSLRMWQLGSERYTSSSQIQVQVPNKRAMPQGSITKRTIHGYRPSLPNS